MKLGVIQSNYVPWRGYFDLIDSVDRFVVYDDAGYSKNTYRNRNQLKFPGGLRWITVPVHAHVNQPIDEVTLAESGTGKARPWREEHERLIRGSLEGAPHFSDALAVWKAGASAACERLHELNVRLIRAVCEYLGVKTPLEDSRRYAPQGQGTARLVDLLVKAGATSYISGPTGKGYIDESLFAKNGIRLEWKSYDYADYPQSHGPFVGTVSVLDLIAHCGPDSRRYLKSRSRDEVAA